MRTNVSHESDPHSILVADCGSALTKVFLIEQVEGQFRFVARGQAPTLLTPATAGLLGSVRQAIAEIEALTGRHFLNPSGELIVPERPDGYGVDAFAMTASAAPPLSVTIAGLSHDLSVASARQGIGTTYAVIKDVIAVEQPQPRHPELPLERQWELLRHDAPDAIVITGGTDGGARTPLIELARQVISAVVAAPQQPSVIFAGNAEARLQVAEMAGSEVDLRIVDNVQPGLGASQVDGLNEEVEEVYWERKMQPLPGFSTLQAWSDAPIVPSVKALAASTRFIARRHGLRVAAVDAGEGATSVVLASPNRGVTAVSSHWRQSPAATADGHPWPPFPPAEVDTRALTTTESDEGSGSLPLSPEWWVRQAAVRESLRSAWERALAQWPQSEPRFAQVSGPGTGQTARRSDLTPHFDLILAGGGRMVHVLHPAEAVLALLDVLQPCGVANLAFDSLSLLPSLGAVAALNPLVAVQVLARDSLVRLGVMVAPVGQARPGHHALRVVMHRDDGSILQTRVPFGSIELLPLLPEHKARLELWPSHRFDVGLGVAGVGAATEVEGGLLGVIVDARGRPLARPRDPAVWQTQMATWLTVLGAAVTS